ncbi:MAG: MarR family transcriptional regulator [Microthrixaceae bacterium]|nr:MarR family transcriptional regulator [Microthrixaceae bacterium]
MAPTSDNDIVKHRGDLAGEVWRALVEVHLSRRHLIDDVAATVGLSSGDLRTLFALQPGVPRAHRVLAEILHRDPANVTWLVDRLEAKGYAERIRHLRDRRVKLVVLTEAGAEAQEKVRAGLAVPPEEFERMEVEDLEALVDLLGRVPRPPYWP